MAPTDLDDVRLLEEEFAEAMTRLYAVGNGLAALRTKLVAERVVVPPQPEAAAAMERPAAAAPDVRPGTPPAPSTPPPAQSTAAVATPGGSIAAAQLPPPWWQREGMVIRALGVAGAGVLLIGVVLLLAFAIQHGLLGPGARVGGAAVLAATLVGVAMRLHRDPSRRAGAVAIAAAGYATAYLDVVAVTAIYRWLPPATGLVIGGLIAASGVVLARAWDRQLLALITVGGVAPLAPAVADGRYLLCAGFLVVLAAAAYPAHIGRAWLALHAVRSLPAAAALVAASDAQPGHPVFVLAVAYAAVELGTALIGTRLRARTALFTPVLLATCVPVLSAAHGAGARLWVVAAAAAAVHLAVALLAGPTPPMMPALALSPWAGGLGVGLAVLAAINGAPEHSRPATLLGLAALALVGARTPAARGATHRWAPVSALALAALALLDYLPLIPRLLSQPLALTSIEVTDVVASGLVAVLGILLPGVLDAVQRPAQAASAGTTSWTLLLSWPLVVIGASAVVVGAATLIGERLGAHAGGFVTGHGLATLLWAAAAAYLLMHGLRRNRDATLSLRMGLVLAAVAVAKLLLFDLAALDGIVRVVAFIGAGLALLAMGAGYARALDRTHVTPDLSRG
ncbi:MAG: DUF2339 domain-containing protein [Tetrasphaera sp.]